MRGAIRRHIKLLDAVSVAAVVVGGLVRELSGPLCAVLLLGGLVCLFAFTLLALPGPKICPTCGFRYSPGHLSVAVRSGDGVFRCPRCGTIVSNTRTDQ